MIESVVKRAKKTKILQNPAVIADIIARRGTGESCEDIGRSYGLCRQSIYRVEKCHEDSVKDIKDRIFADNIENYAAALKKDVANSHKIAVKYNREGKISPAEVAYKTTVNKAMAPVLVGKGINPSPAFANINIDNSKNVNVDPDMFRMLSMGFKAGYMEMRKPEQIEEIDEIQDKTA